MDQAFLLRAQRLLGDRKPAAIDHSRLLAIVAQRQAASPTALAQARCRDGGCVAAGPGALAALLLGEEGWREASHAQAGCFNRAIATRPLNGE